MTSQARKIRVGVFTAVALGLFAIVLIVFGGLRVWERHDHYRIVFSSSVMGIHSGAEVYLDGIQVGRVVDLAVTPEDLRKVAVTIEVARGTPVHADTRATMQMSGLTGLKVIELGGGTYAAPAVPDGGTILEGEGALDRLQRQAESVAEQSTELLKRANHIVDNLEQLTDPRRFAALDDVIARARVTADNLAAASASMRAMIDDNRVIVREAVGSVRETAAGAGEVVAQVKTLVQANAGPVRAAVFDLRQASRSLKDLARELRQRPSRLLFSGAPDERKLP